MFVFSQEHKHKSIVTPLKESTMHHLITEEDLLKNSSKVSAKAYWDGYMARHKCEPTQRRHPDTIIGFITKEKLAEMFENQGKYPDHLLFATGLTLISDGKVVFLTDDSQYGYDALPKSFATCTMSNLHMFFGKGQEYEDVDDLLQRIASNERHLNSVQELLDYLNNK
jgi:hypothetical protein